MEIKSELWGIPGTGKVPSPEKELKKLIDKGKRDFQHSIDEIADDVEGKAKKVLNKAGREIRNGLHEAGEEIEEGIKAAADQAEDAIEDAFYALAGQVVHLAVNDAVDAIQSKLFHGPLFLKLWWFRFYIDPDSKIDALQRAASHPPKGKQQIVKLLRELVDDDEVEFRPEFPLLAAFGGKVKVNEIEDAVEFVVMKLGL